VAGDRGELGGGELREAAKLILYFRGWQQAGRHPAPRIDHFHAERGVLKSQGCRTGVAIIHDRNDRPAWGRENEITIREHTKV